MSMMCPACGADQATTLVAEPIDREYYNERTISVVVQRCDGCLSLFQNPWPDAEETASFYESDYQNYTTTHVPLLSQVNDVYQRLIGQSFLKEYGADAAVLDFGCGQGSFLQVLADAGCRNLAGFDFVLYSELKDISDTRFFDNLDDIRKSGTRFDVIRMRHVIEHLTDLDETMRLLRSLLTERGRIIGQTPNAAHYTVRLMGQYWGPLHYPYHTVLFSPPGLAAATERWGLRLEKTTGSILPSGWAISLENIYKAITHSRTRGRTAGYTFLMGLTLPLSTIDLILSPAATANFDFVLAPTTR